jgi:hypothetical protein
MGATLVKASLWQRRKLSLIKTDQGGPTNLIRQTAPVLLGLQGRGRWRQVCAYAPLEEGGRLPPQ